MISYSTNDIGMEKVTNLENMLALLSSLSTKARHFNDDTNADKLVAIRKDFYYNRGFDYDLSVSELKNIKTELEKYDAV